MVTISGPRQCGKTTLTETLPILKTSKAYYNWDIDEHRKIIRSSTLDESKEYWILDEIHKYSRWRNWLKGLYDLHRKDHKIIVTGSARLDLYSRGGDSLQGRYFNYRLHPFTLSELMELEDYDYKTFVNISPKNKLKLEYDEAIAKQKLEDLLTYGGFPEPYTVKSLDFSSRWRNEYSKRLVNEDVRMLEQIQQLDQMGLLYERLPELVANNLSINNLALDLETAHQTISKWLNIFEKLYGCFRILPFEITSKKLVNTKIKLVKKERKTYLWDWGKVPDSGPRLENLVAVHLLRLVHWFEDIYGEIIELRYFRDVDGHEIDFLILKNKEPWVAIEVKSTAQGLNPGMKYFLERVKVPFAFQIHLKGDLDTRVEGINGCRVRIMPISRFLCWLP